MDRHRQQKSILYIHGIKYFKGMMIMSISVFDVSNAFLTFESMTHKKLQKLCYYAQAWYLALNNDRLFNNEFEAWVHGPVCSELYNKYRGFGWDEIQKVEIYPKSITQNEDALELIYEIHRIYGGLSGDELEDLTHSELPWQEAREDLKPWRASNNTLNENTMAEFYLNQLKEESSA